jgi:tRNA(Ile)-lysidine synthase
MSVAEKNRQKRPVRVKHRQSKFAQSLLAEWKRLRLPVAHERVVVAVSGGADSVALLLGVEELLRGGRLNLTVTVAHLDHGLREGAGREDALWVEALAEGLQFEMVLGQAAVKEGVLQTGDNLEQAARRARYEFLTEVAEECGARIVLAGHTMDDQAETGLLRLLRGSGADGLGGMRPLRELTPEIRLARPMLGWARRAETEKYCRERGVEFRADEMNEDEGFARVRVRRKLLPLMESFNPRAVPAITRAAELLREDASALRDAAAELLRSACEEEVEGGGAASVTGSLSVDILKSAPAALRRRALRLWLMKGRGDLRRVEMVHLLGVEKLLEGERGGRRAQLPGGGFVEVRRGRLRFHVK